MNRRELMESGMTAGIAMAFAQQAQAARVPIKKAVLGSMLPKELPEHKQS